MSLKQELQDAKHERELREKGLLKDNEFIYRNEQGEEVIESADDIVYDVPEYNDKGLIKRKGYIQGRSGINYGPEYYKETEKVVVPIIVLICVIIAIFAIAVFLIIKFMVIPGNFHTFLTQSYSELLCNIALCFSGLI